LNNIRQLKKNKIKVMWIVLGLPEGRQKEKGDQK
jgi:hypothetical protein